MKGKILIAGAAVAAAALAYTPALLDLVAPVSSWDDGIPLGNGSAGALLWGGGDTLNVTLDRADFWHNILPTCYDSPNFTWDMLVDTVVKKDDARRREMFDKGESATKLPGVRLVLKLGGGQTVRRFKLDGATASATVTVATPSGDRDIVAWFDDGDTLLSMRVPDGVTFDSKTFVKNPSFARLGGYPEPEITIDDGQAVYRRLRRTGSNNRFDKDFEAGVRFRPAGEVPRSAFWPKFNAESEVSIPDPKLQRQYDFAMYLYGAGARAGCAPLALQGLWTADDGKLPPWHGDYHNDMNTEMTYWAAGPAGRIEALEAFADFFIERLPECREFCHKIFKGGDGAVIPPTMGYAAQPILGWTAYTLPPTHGIWAFNTFCDAWDYDPTPEKAAKYLAFGRELAAGVEHAWKMVDGVRKLDISCSPEVGNNSNACFLTPNSTYERVILDSFYTWLARLAEACGEGAEAAKWRGYVGTFGPPNVAKDGTLEISAGNLLKESHRHPSHLVQVFPLTNVPRDNGVDFVKSVEQWEGLGTGWWVGFSFPWAGCFEARLGRGDRAFRYLKDFQRAFTSRCGFNLNGDQLKCGLSKYTYRPFTLEANFGFARGIQEMLLSYDSHSNTYRLFPALPKEWDGKEVSFRNLRLPGGHRVSAKRAADGTITHEILPNPRTKSVPSRVAAGRMDRSKLLIGAYCLQQNARTDAHVKAIHDCGVDFIIGVPAADRATLDLFAKHGVGAIVNGVVPGWWGGDGKNAGKMRESNPPGKYAGAIAAFKDHPAIWAIDIGDEPSALDFPYYGEVVRQINKALPGMPLYLNLYPNYASVSQNTGRQTVNQLGTPTYGEHIDVYCKNVPLDYISYDFYPYTGPGALNRFISRMYDNFIVVADACRRTKRSFWYIPQVNSRVGIAPTSVNQLRFQANAALSFGAEAVTWGCWCKGWWTNNVLDSAGKQTEQYDKLKRVNMELKRIGPRYMRYRNVATRFVGFDSGSPWRPSLSFPGASDNASTIRASNGAQLLVGEMVARDATRGECAFYVTAADDPTDAHPSPFEIVFDAKGKAVEAFGGEGYLPVTRRADGFCSVPLASCQGVLIVTRQTAELTSKNK